MFLSGFAGLCRAEGLGANFSVFLCGGTGTGSPMKFYTADLKAN